MINLHIFTHEDKMIYNFNGVLSSFYLFLSRWHYVAEEFGINLTIAPSPKTKILNDSIRKIRPCEKATNLWAMNTFFEINNKLVFIDAYDKSKITVPIKLAKPHVDLYIKMQYAPHKARKHHGLIVPFTYFSTNDLLFPEFRKKRLEVLKNRQFKYSMTFGGMNKKQGTRTGIFKFLNDTNKIKRSKVGFWPIKQYLENVVHSVVGVASRGWGDFCYRDIELMALGVPMVRKKFTNITKNLIVPNEHYYTLGGDEVGIDKQLTHYAEYFEPNGNIREFSKGEWDEYIDISHKGVTWYEQNASAKGSFRLLLQILEENNIL